MEADYLVYPWLMTIMRWDQVKSTADLLNGIGASPDSDIGAFVSPFHSTRNRFTPGVQFLIHANIKASFEYQIRPQQIVYVPGTYATPHESIPHQLCGCRTGVGVLESAERQSLQEQEKP